MKEQEFELFEDLKQVVKEWKYTHKYIPQSKAVSQSVQKICMKTYVISSTLSICCKYWLKQANIVISIMMITECGHDHKARYWISEQVHIGDLFKDYFSVTYNQFIGFKLQRTCSTSSNTQPVKQQKQHVVVKSSHLK